MQTTDTLLMIRPASFGFNPETAANNAFQSTQPYDAAAVNAAAQQEFNDMVALLRAHEIHVEVVDDLPEPRKPDAVFPNNWLSILQDGAQVTYPMFAPNRRIERNEQALEAVQKLTGNSTVHDWTAHEAENHFLEGTGSMVLDHEHKRAYACRSPRTCGAMLSMWAATFGYQPVLFDAVDVQGAPIYHTNVVMSIGEEFVVACLEAIPSEVQRRWLVNHFNGTPHMVIPITRAQMQQFAGNMLQVRNRNQQRFIVLSQTAFNSLGEVQLNRLRAHGKLLTPNLQTIETYGGGSARCMMAEVFIP